MKFSPTPLKEQDIEIRQLLTGTAIIFIAQYFLEHPVEMIQVKSKQ